MAEEMTSLEGFLDKLQEQRRRQSMPCGWISAEGDCAFFYLEPDPHYRQRVDDLLTLYRAHEDDRIVGVEIKGVKELPAHDALAVVVEDGEVEVVQLLLLTFGREARSLDLSTLAERTRHYSEALAAFQGTGRKRPRINVEELMGA